MRKYQAIRQVKVALRDSLTYREAFKKIETFFPANYSIQPIFQGGLVTEVRVRDFKENLERVEIKPMKFE